MKTDLVAQNHITEQIAERMYAFIRQFPTGHGYYTFAIQLQSGSIIYMDRYEETIYRITPDDPHHTEALDAIVSASEDSEGCPAF